MRLLCERVQMFLYPIMTIMTYRNSTFMQYKKAPSPGP